MYWQLVLDILRQHVLPEIVCSQSVSPTRSLTLRNAAGHYITVTRPHGSVAAAATADANGSGQKMNIEGAHSTQSDIMASNGVLHIIDQVLFHSSGYINIIIICLFVHFLE